MINATPLPEDVEQPPLVAIHITARVVDEVLKRRGFIPCELHRLLVKQTMLANPLLWESAIVNAVNQVAEYIERNN